MASDYELLERRVSALERDAGRLKVLEDEVEGEKMVTRHILEQTRRNSEDVAAMRKQLDRMETRQDRMEGDLTGLRSEVGGLRSEVRSLRVDLPGIVAETMREVLRERDR